MATTLKKGSKGGDVKALQEALNKAKPPPKPPLKIDGIFGPKTLAALKAYQKKQKLKVDGIAGPNTGTAFLKMPGGAVGKKIGEKLGGGAPTDEPGGKGGGGGEEKEEQKVLQPDYLKKMMTRKRLCDPEKKAFFAFGKGGDLKSHVFTLSNESKYDADKLWRIVKKKTPRGTYGPATLEGSKKLVLTATKKLGGLKKILEAVAKDRGWPLKQFKILDPSGKEVEDEDDPDDDDKDAPKDDKELEQDKTWIREAIESLQKAGYDGAAALMKQFEELAEMAGMLAAAAVAALKKLVEAAVEAWEEYCKEQFEEKLAKEVRPAIDALEKQVKKLDAKDAKPFDDTLKKLNKTVAALEKDTKKSWSEKYAALDKIKKVAEEETMDAEVRAMDPADKKTGEKIKKLVAKRFNVKFDFKLEGGPADLEKEGETLKQLYETLAKAPVWPGDKLKVLNVTVLERASLKGEGGVYNSDDNRAGVTCKRPKDSLNYGKQLNRAKYFPDGVDENCKAANDDPVDYFSWATLHEVGHALDAQTGFMKNNQSDTKYGGWTDYGTSVGPIAKVAANHFGKDLKSAEKANLEKYALTQMLGGSAAAHKSDDEKAAREKVKTWVAGIKADQKIWWNGTACKNLQIGDIVYLEAYAGRRWVSYELKARKQGIHGYQFRAPGEWFAELYAAYYSKKLKDDHPFVPKLKELEK